MQKKKYTKPTLNKDVNLTKIAAGPVIGPPPPPGPVGSGPLIL